VYGGKGRWVQYWARLGCWISPCCSPFSLGRRFETYEPFISLIFQFFFGPWWTADTESADTGAHMYVTSSIKYIWKCAQQLDINRLLFLDAFCARTIFEWCGSKIWRKYKCSLIDRMSVGLCRNLCQRSGNDVLRCFYWFSCSWIEFRDRSELLKVLAVMQKTILLFPICKCYPIHDDSYTYVPSKYNKVVFRWKIITFFLWYCKHNGVDKSHA
jgi:hypothetical protein